VLYGIERQARFTVLSTCETAVGIPLFQGTTFEYEDSDNAFS
jgi:CHAT domain-containing protein